MSVLWFDFTDQSSMFIRRPVIKTKNMVFWAKPAMELLQHPSRGPAIHPLLVVLMRVAGGLGPIPAATVRSNYRNNSSLYLLCSLIQHPVKEKQTATYVT